MNTLLGAIIVGLVVYAIGLFIASLIWGGSDA
jgi:uncharacterized membrane protein YiaA